MLPLLILAFILTAVTGCRKTTQDVPPKPEKISDITEEALIWADSVVNTMTPEQQAAQLLMPAIYAKGDKNTSDKIKWYAEQIGVGGILLLKGDAVAAAEIADTLEAIRSRADIQAGYFLSIDAETGLAMRFSDAPKFPWNGSIPDSIEDQIFYDYGREIGRESILTGINMIMGPVVDVDRGTSVKGVMSFRSLGSDHQRVAELSVAYSAGLESQGVISVAKHFPGHGATSSDSHKGMPVISISKEEVYTTDLLPFRNYVENGLSGIMVGHIWMQALDSINRPASFSPVIMKDILRKEMDFKGLVLVDAMGMGGAKGYTSADAIEAGADIIIAPEDTEAALAVILNSIEVGRISLADLREKVKRVLFYKYLFNIPFAKRGDIPTEELKERLHQEALPVINSLSGR